MGGPALRRRLVVAAIAYGPTIAWIVVLVVAFGPSRLGWVRAAALAVLTGIGILGLTGLVLAFLPAAMERLGFRRAGAFLRRWWDEEAL